VNKNLPDKWIRKSIYDLINNITVDGKTIPCYDTNVTDQGKDFYILISTQSSGQQKINKCEDQWLSTVLVDVFTRYRKSGNTGSRLFAENISDEVRRLTNGLVLDSGSGLNIVWQNTNFAPDISSSTKNEKVFRKLIQYEFLIN